jgi:RNA polymerase II subunit A small phosphatase-like protein
MTSLGRPLERSIIVDNSPHSYAFQPQNALPISSFIDDPADDDLLDSIPILQELAVADDVTQSLVENRGYVPRRTFHSRNIPIPDRRYC